MAGYGFTNNRGNHFNTIKAMERHMDGNSISAVHRPSSSYAHSYPAAGESFFTMKENIGGGGGGEHPGNNNIVEQDLFEKVRMQMTQLNYRRRNNWWVKPNIHQSNNGEYDHKPSGLQNGKYNFYAAAQGGAQRFRFGAPAGDYVSSK